MSRVNYANVIATKEQEMLRISNKVKLINEVLEGTGIDALPGGIYGFTFSPALHNSPLFRAKHFRSYEIHKLDTGLVCLIGFVQIVDATRFKDAKETFDVLIQPEPEPDADVLLAIPYSCISQHHQFSVPTDHGIKIAVTP
jgi:hypothetical protein